METIDLLFKKIADPEYRHLLLEPVLIYGVLIGAAAFVLAFLFKERKMQLTALLVLIVSALMVVPYLSARSTADKRAEKLFSAQAEQIAAQRETRKDSQWAYFAVAGLAGVTLLMGAHKGKAGLVVGVATVGAAGCLVLFGMAMHLKDSQIYHPNLRGSPPALADHSEASGEAEIKQRIARTALPSP